MEIEISKMTERGQITIPQEIRERLDLKTGEKIVFVETQGKLVLEPMSKMKGDVIEKLKEDLEFARETEEAWKRYDKGEFISQDADEFLEEMKKWANE